jgi:hypothetical protein
MMIGDGIVSLIWILNTLKGNNGGFLHLIFWRASQASALLAFLELVFELMATLSYGAKINVWNSWLSMDVSNAIWTTKAAN